jgi:hypothetical protein
MNYKPKDTKTMDFFLSLDKHNNIRNAMKIVTTRSLDSVYKTIKK